jgi:hypothetical protein
MLAQDTLHMMKTAPEDYPIRAQFLETGLQTDLWFDSFLNRARIEGPQQAQYQYEFARALGHLAVIGRETRPDLIPEDMYNDALRDALGIFESLESHGGSRFMAAMFYANGWGCDRDYGAVRDRLDQAVALGCRDKDAISTMYAFLDRFAPAARPAPDLSLNN